MQQAPNVGRNLVIKVATIIGFSCLLRESEIYNVDWNQVSINADNIALKVNRNKRTGSAVEQTYFVTDPFLVNIVKLYVELFREVVCLYS